MRSSPDEKLACKCVALGTERRMAACSGLYSLNIILVATAWIDRKALHVACPGLHDKCPLDLTSEIHSISFVIHTITCGFNLCAAILASRSRRFHFVQLVCASSGHLMPVVRALQLRPAPAVRRAFVQQQPRSTKKKSA